MTELSLMMLLEFSPLLRNHPFQITTDIQLVTLNGDP